MRGASNKLLQFFGTESCFPILGEQEINHLLDYICATSRSTKVYYLWRPVLKDPGDDMVLELGVASGADFIVTYNRKDFKEAHNFGLEIICPKELLVLMGELS